MTIKYSKIPYGIPDSREIDQMAIKYTNIFRCKALQNLPKLRFFGLKNIPSGNPAVEEEEKSAEIFLQL
jgi:hypothetical protein